MTQLAETRTLTGADSGRVEVLSSLARASSRNGATSMAQRLLEIRAWMTDELALLENTLRECATTDGDLADRAASHLLAAPGKRIRPLCVFLAARTGGPVDAAEINALATACELVHSATLLHDDVIDEGTDRRGRPASRVVYGNSASVLGGDYLLIEALRRVTATGRTALLTSLLEVIDQMIRAEAIQLESRGCFDPNPERYNTIVDGKTAALFRWGMEAGATSSGAPEHVISALGQTGTALGRAFQLTDDILDLKGAVKTLGKNTFADLREGKFTWPLIVACERDAGLVATFRDVASNPDMLEDDALTTSIQARILKTGALEASQAEAMKTAHTALSALEVLPEGRVREALHAVVHTAIARVK